MLDGNINIILKINVRPQPPQARCTIKEIYEHSLPEAQELQVRLKTFSKKGVDLCSPCHNRGEMVTKIYKKYISPFAHGSWRYRYGRKTGWKIDDFGMKELFTFFVYANEKMSIKEIGE